MIREMYLAVVLSIVPLLSLTFKGCQSYHVKDGSDLVQHLCGHGLKPDDVDGHSVSLELSATGSYIIPSNASSCVVNGKFSSLFIYSSVENESATVNCTDNRNLNDSSFGIVLVNVNVTIKGIFFERCGANLEVFGDNLMNKFISASNNSFRQSHAAIFVFVGGNVAFNDVKFNHSIGFAVIAVNIVGGHFNKLFIIDSDSLNQSSGVLLIFTPVISNPPMNCELASKVIFQSCTFRAGSNVNDRRSFCAPFGTIHQPPAIIRSSAGLTLLSFRVTRNVSLTISNSNFQRNFGSYAGALLVELMDTTNTRVIINENTCFQTNYNLFNCPGSAMVFHMFSNNTEIIHAVTSKSIIPLSVTDTNFIKHDGITDVALSNNSLIYGTIYIGVRGMYKDMEVEFINVHFCKNNADSFASALFVDIDPFALTKVKVSLKNILVKENQQKSFQAESKMGVFVFAHVYCVEISDGSYFANNNGSVIKSYNSRIFLRGQVQFKNNFAFYGAALNVHNGLIYFKDGLNLLLHNNIAKHMGGAIHIDNDEYHSTLTALCALQLTDSFEISLLKNSAEKSGNVIYAYPAYHCIMLHDHDGELEAYGYEYYNKKLNFTQNDVTSNNLLPLSSAVNRIEFINLTHKLIPHYPGEWLSFAVNVTDGGSKHVYSPIKVFVIEVYQNESKSKPSTFSVHHQYQELKEQEFSNFQIQLTSKTDLPESHHLSIYLATMNGIWSSKYPLNIEKCPPGFSLKSMECKCNNIISKHFVHNNAQVCNITSHTIPIPRQVMTNSWIGNIYENISNISKNISEYIFENFTLSNSCPLDLCTSTYNHESYMIQEIIGTNTTHFTIDQEISICQPYRQGVICGECTDNTSVVFGSSECKHCSNWWLWSIILYMIAGPTLICVMYMLRLTLKAGTLNAIIFFAQIAEVGLMEGMMYFREHVPLYSLRFVFIFISLLNLNLGFPLCFFNGMNEFWKTGLSLVFPIYLLSITLIMICVGHKYTNRFSNRFIYSSVQILVTVVHLSLSKLLIITIDVFTPAIIYNEDNSSAYVWYSNGNEPFNIHNTRLIILMVLTTIVTGVFLVPYVIILSIRNCLTKYRLTYLRLAYETMHMPYRDNRKYWFACRFLLQMLLYSVYAIFRTFNLPLVYFMSLPLLIAFLIIQVYLRPFKSKGLNVLDLAVMLILVIMYIIVSHIAFDYPSPKTVKLSMSFLVALTIVMFVLFVCVIGYHFSVVATLYQRVSALWRIKRSQTDPESKKQLLKSSKDLMDSFYRSCDKESPFSGYL